MQHLPELHKPARRFPRVPYLNDHYFKYDGKGLKDFDRRCGWPLESLVETDRISALFQNWLFFGTLTDLFKEWGLNVIYADFLTYDQNGHVYITTELLEDYIAAWTVKCYQEDRDCLSKNRTFEIDANIPFESQYNWFVRGSGHASGLHAAAAHFASSLRDGSQSFTQGLKTLRRDVSSTSEYMTECELYLRTRDALTTKRINNQNAIFINMVEIFCRMQTLVHLIKPEIWDSVLISCNMLYSAFRRIYRFRDHDLTKGISLRAFAFRGQLSLNSSMWCPRDQQLLAQRTDGDKCALSLCTQLKRTSIRANHATCTTQICNLRQVNVNTYRTKHVQDGCSCQTLGCEAELQRRYLASDQNSPSVKDRYLSKPIPMIIVQNGPPVLIDMQLPAPHLAYSDRLSERFVEPCVAFSHMWADGLGNVKHNALPGCQLLRLQVSAQ